MSNLDEYFDLIKKRCYSKNIEFDGIIQKYLKNTISSIEEKKKTYSIKEVLSSTDLKKVAGVYLIYLKSNNGRINFTYIGETSDIKRRWKEHIASISDSKKTLYKKIRKKIKDNSELLDQIRFVILENDLDDKNKRLYRETYFIYKFKTKFYSLNNKNCSRELKCKPHGTHGLCKTHIGKDEVRNRVVVYAKSKNKLCGKIFIVD